jgi:hypothetical protein
VGIMVLTPPRREKQQRSLATVAVRSGGCSGSGEVVPVVLLTSRENKRAHEHRGNEKSSKRPLARRGTDWSSVST